MLPFFTLSYRCCLLFLNFPFLYLLMFVNVDIFKISIPFREVDRSSILLERIWLLVLWLLVIWIFVVCLLFTVNINYLETSIPVLSLWTSNKIYIFCFEFCVFKFFFIWEITLCDNHSLGFKGYYQNLFVLEYPVWICFICYFLFESLVFVFIDDNGCCVLITAWWDVCQSGWAFAKWWFIRGCMSEDVLSEDVCITYV